MSIECSECERDLRGGHALGCSRFDLTRATAKIIARHGGDRDTYDEDWEPHPTVEACAAEVVELFKRHLAAKETAE